MRRRHDPMGWMMIKKAKTILEQLKSGRFAPLYQFVKFGLVGVSNTLIQYGMEMLCYYALFRNVSFASVSALGHRLGIAVDAQAVKVFVVTALAFIVSVTNAFYWNSRFVFAGQSKKTWRQQLRTYCKTVACYALTGLVLSPAIKVWLGRMHVPYWGASLLSLIVTIPLNFLMNKFWAFRANKSQSS